MNDKLGLARDITKRNEVENALREKTQTISAIVDTSQDWIWAINLQGIHTYSNPAVKHILGYPPDKLVGNPSFDLMHKDDRQMVATKLPLWISEKKGWKSLVIRWRHKDGSWRYLESSAVPIIDANGKIAGFRGVDRDITESKYAEDSLKRSEKRFKTLFGAAPDAYYLSDLKGNFIDGNKAAVDLMGYKKEELIGKSFLKLNLLSTEEILKASKALMKNVQGKGTGPDEFILNRKDGSQVPVEIRTYPVEIDDETVVLGIARDITKRKLAEEEKEKFITDLMEREEKYRTLTQNLNVGVYRSTPGKNGKIIEANHALINLFGLRSKKSLEKWKVVDLYPNPLERDRIEEQLASKGFLINEELKLRKNDGTIFSASISATATKDESGKVIHYDGIIEDVTEELKIREDILAYQSNLKSLTNELLVTEEEAKRRLAMTLHDKLLQSLVLANLKSSELNKIVEKSEHKKLISEISGFLEDAINESRNITYELSPSVLYEMGLIPAIYRKLEEIEKNNKIKTSLADQSKSYEFDEGDQIILYRTISELLQNVIKHSKADKVNVSFRLLTNDYRITVSDNGVGFDLEAMKENAVSQKKFGLFSIMERIKFIGGEVLINSVPKKGTKIVIDLPLKD